MVSDPRSDNIILPVYILNLEKKLHSKKACLKEFETRPEFDVKIVNSESEFQLESAWQKIKGCVINGIEEEDDFIILCNYSHKFTIGYTKTILLQAFVEACKFGCDILLCGIDKFNQAVPLTNNLFWVDSFNHSTFIVLFKTSFKKIMERQIENENSVYEILSYLTSHKMALFPFISEINLGNLHDQNERNELEFKQNKPGNELAIYKEIFKTYLKNNV